MEANTAPPGGPLLLIVPGLRDHVAQHWQTLLAEGLPNAHSLPPMGRDDLALDARIDALEAAVRRLSTRPAAPVGAGCAAEDDGAQTSAPVLLIAHSGGCVLVAHWARRTALAHRVAGALLATPPTFDRPLPPAYPQLEALDAAGWLPVPQQRLPFPSLVAASHNDPLGDFAAVCELARRWGSDLEDLGEVGHLNPASGFGAWPQAETLIRRLSSKGKPLA
jgi:predicted alpha/beta hydrolase family esterase